MSARPVATALIALLLPGALARPLLRALGHRIGAGVRLGWSWLMVERLALESGARIGPGNILRVRRLVMRRQAYLGRGNVVHGPVSLQLAEQAALGNNNKVVRGPAGLVAPGPARLRLGRLAKITAEHRIDCTCSVSLGDFTTLAGTGSQIWTHGYVHALQGSDRYRIDGPVRIGSNVYVGARCIVSSASIIDGAMVGAGSTVARDLTEPGLYVSAGLRRLDRPADPRSRPDLEPSTDPRLCETVYVRKPR